MAETTDEQAARKLSSQLAARAMKRLGLRYVATDELTIRRKRIGDKSNLVVASASAIAGENALVELSKDLEAAFDRFLVNPTIRWRGRE